MRPSKRPASISRSAASSCRRTNDPRPAGSANENEGLNRERRNYWRFARALATRDLSPSKPAVAPFAERLISAQIRTTAASAEGRLPRLKIAPSSLSGKRFTWRYGCDGGSRG